MPLLISGLFVNRQIAPRFCVYVINYDGMLWNSQQNTHKILFLADIIDIISINLCYLRNKKVNSEKNKQYPNVGNSHIAICCTVSDIWSTKIGRWKRQILSLLVIGMTSY